MKVKDFVKLYEGSYNINIELYELNENVEFSQGIEALRNDDGLHEEWKNAEVEGWNISGDYTITLSVIK
jgi:hypothetical protein